MLIKGSDLTHTQRQEVLSAFPYRWTVEAVARFRRSYLPPCPACTPAVNDPKQRAGLHHNHPTLPMETDDRWLTEHAFHFTKDGLRLSKRHRFCEAVCMAEADWD